MLENYFKIALRNLARFKTYSFINIAGLSIGIACFIIIFLFINNELGYDNFHNDGDRIYRVLRTSSNANENYRIGITSAPFSTALQNDFSNEIEEVLRVMPGEALVTYNDKSFFEKNFYLADSNFFSFFNFPLLKGDASSVLSSPNDIVISDEMARKYFGNENPVGKILIAYTSINFNVTGVFKASGNSHLNFDFVASISYFRSSRWFSDWWSNAMFTYIRLNSAASEKNLEEKFPSFMEKYFGKDFERTGIRTDIMLQPLKDIYLDSDIKYDPITHGDRQVIYMFSAIALFILLIACINFMNLTTARSSKRAKEIGIRKVVGAHRYNLSFQFLGEALIISFISLLASLLIVEISLPYINSFINKDIVFPENKFLLILFLIFFTIAVGIVSGSYPALVLSSFKPSKVLKGTTIRNTNNIFRKVLVTFQFCISVLLIASTLVIIKQMNYVSDKKLGFNKEQILILPINSTDIYRSRETFKDEILSLKGVENVTAISGEPGGFHDNYSFKIEGKEDGYFRMRTLFTDGDYLETFNMKIIAGRNFSEEFSTDKHATILNETAVKNLDWTNEEAIGKRLMVNLVDTTYRTIIGVVKDFHFSSLKDKIEPLAISTHTDQRVIAIEVNAANIVSTLDEIKNSWQRIIPSYPFEYNFLDQTFAKLYEAEQKQLKIFSFFAILAILIACLGLFGLTAFTAEQKTKEIGIRKVLGASVMGILLLFSKDFLKLIVIANLIAIPLIYYLMNKWLQDFAYRTEVDVTIFIISTALVLIISLLTIGAQAFKAATANPVKSLRYE